MFRMGLLGFILFAFIGASTFAKDTESLNAAGEVCSDLYLPSDKDSCSQIVKTSSYFDRAAIKVCSGLNLPSEKIECLDKIREKKFLKADLDGCKKQSMASDKINCLASAGSPEKSDNADAGSQESAARILVKKAIKNIEKRNYAQAKMLLQEVLTELK